MTTRTSAAVAVFGSPVDEGAVRQIETCMADERAVAGALMADHHLGYSMPIGGVIVYEGAVSPSGVGFDIACGNKAVRTNLRGDDVELVKRDALLDIQRRVEFGVGRRNKTPIDHALFDDPAWPELERLHPGIKDLAAAQLGTVGSGNHYVDLLVDEDGQLWVANHFGSRGFGHKVATGFLNLAKSAAFTDRLAESEEPTVLNVDSDLGALYVAAMTLAGDYAYAGRDYVIEQVLAVLDAEATFSVHNHHNFAWKDGNEYIVRKGATPLTREPAFIGGSMGDDSVIVRGKCPDEFQGYDMRDGAGVLEIGALGSAPHGAGRAMSRTKAAGKWTKIRVERKAPDGTTFQKKIRVRDKTTAAIDWDATREELWQRGVHVLGAGADEAPAAYKRLDEVLPQHSNVEVLHRLRPIGVVMAGENEFDPYKD